MIEAIAARKFHKLRSANPALSKTANIQGE